MLDHNEVFRLLRAGQAPEVHRRLDVLSGSADASLRRTIAHWRTSALLHERRYSEALDHLDASKNDYGCLSLVHHKKAGIFDVLGRQDDAIAELQAAPLMSEFDSHPELVANARFYLAYLKAKNGRRVLDTELSRIPDDYVSVLPEGARLYGAHVSKSDIIALLRASRSGGDE